jgi:biotin carboxyl carrier protein
VKYTLFWADGSTLLCEVDDSAALSQATARGSLLTIRSGNQQEQSLWCAQGEAMWFASALGQHQYVLKRGAASLQRDSSGATKKTLKSQIPGKVLRLLVQAGDTVTVGQPLLIIEAMKMENEVRSTTTGMVEKIEIEVGQRVESGDLLLRFAPQEPK